MDRHYVPAWERDNVLRAAKLIVAGYLDIMGGIPIVFRMKLDPDEEDEIEFVLVRDERSDLLRYESMGFVETDGVHQPIVLPIPWKQAKVLKWR